MEDSDMFLSSRLPPMAKLPRPSVAPPCVDLVFSTMVLDMRILRDDNWHLTENIERYLPYRGADFIRIRRRAARGTPTSRAGAGTAERGICVTDGTGRRAAGLRVDDPPRSGLPRTGGCRPAHAWGRVLHRWAAQAALLARPGAGPMGQETGHRGACRGADRE